MTETASEPGSIIAPRGPPRPGLLLHLPPSLLRRSTSSRLDAARPTHHTPIPSFAVAAGHAVLSAALAARPSRPIARHTVAGTVPANPLATATLEALQIAVPLTTTRQGPGKTITSAEILTAGVVHLGRRTQASADAALARRLLESRNRRRPDETPVHQGQRKARHRSRYSPRLIVDCLLFRTAPVPLQPVTGVRGPANGLAAPGPPVPHAGIGLAHRATAAHLDRKPRTEPAIEAGPRGIGTGRLALVLEIDRGHTLAVPATLLRERSSRQLHLIRGRVEGQALIESPPVPPTHQAHPHLLHHREEGDAETPSQARREGALRDHDHPRRLTLLRVPTASR